MPFAPQAGPVGCEAASLQAKENALTYSKSRPCAQGPHDPMCAAHPSSTQGADNVTLASPARVPLQANCWPAMRQATLTLLPA